MGYVEANNFRYDVREGERNGHTQVIAKYNMVLRRQWSREGLKWVTSKIWIAHDICILISSHLAWKSDLIYLQNFKTVKAGECSLGNVCQSISSETSVDFSGEGREGEREKKNQHNFLQVEFISLLKHAIQLCSNYTSNFKEPCCFICCKHFKFPKKMLAEEVLKKKKWNKLLYNKLLTRFYYICIYSCALTF